MTETAESLMEQASTARVERRLRKAVDLFQAALAVPDGQLGPKRRRWAYIQSLKSITRLGEWPEAEAIARKGLSEFPDAAYLHQCLGEALMQLGSPEEAESSLERALGLDPEQDGARVLLATLRNPRPVARDAVQPRVWPNRQAMFRSPRYVIRRYLLRQRPRANFIRPDTVFMTLGSCFAQNLAQRLQAAGYTAHSEEIGEEVNSTYANRYLLEWIENGPTDACTEAMDQAFGEKRRKRLKRKFQACQVFVMTLGVAPSFFDDQGAFVFIPQSTRTSAAALADWTMRTTTVAENVENVGRIVDAVRRLAGPEVRIVLTVSPVPMSGTTELESAITADCLSKSTLRVACQEVVTARGAEGVIYWPSFEIVRWLGPHFGPEVPPVYGAEDSNTRHVSQWLVDLIVGQFLEFHAEGPA